MSVDKPLDTEQSVVSAFDVWRTKRNRREAKLNVANKLLKKSDEKKKKESKWSYQKSQVTLKNVDKALSQASPSSQLLTKQEPFSPPTKAANVLNQLLKLRPKKQQPSLASALQINCVTNCTTTTFDTANFFSCYRFNNFAKETYKMVLRTL